MRPFWSDRAPPPLRDPERDVFFAFELFAEDVFPAEPEDVDLDVPLFTAPPFEELPLAADAPDDPDFDPPEDFDAVDREDPVDFDDPVRDDEADFDAGVFFAAGLAADELLVVFDEDDPDFDPDEDFAPTDFELDDFAPPDLELPGVDDFDFEDEDFLVVGILCFLRLLESTFRFDRLLSKQHSTPT